MVPQNWMTQYTAYRDVLQLFWPCLSSHVLSLVSVSFLPKLIFTHGHRISEFSDMDFCAMLWELLVSCCCVTVMELSMLVTLLRVDSLKQEWLSLSECACKHRASWRSPESHQESWAGSDHRESTLVIMKNMMILIDEANGALPHRGKVFHCIVYLE